MSLDELLKDEKESMTWMAQKKKLIQISFGILIMAFTLIGGFIWFNSLNDKKKVKRQISQMHQDYEAQSVAQLMKLQQKAQSLQEEIENIKKQASIFKEDKKDSSVKTQSNRKINHVKQQYKSSPQQIIDYDPGEGFVEVAVSNKINYIPTGAIFRARLITPIKTSVAKTFVLAETINEFRMDGKRRIPKGSRLIGRSRLNPILKGVIVEFNTLVLPNGTETTLNALALSRNALPEIDGLYFSDDLQNYGTALAFGFLSGFADAARERERTVFGYQAEESLTNQVLAGLSTSSFQVAEEILRDIRSKAVEYVVIPAGEPVFVVLTRRYMLTQRGQK